MKPITYILIVALSLSSCVITKKQRENFCNNNCKSVSTEYIHDSIYIKDTVVKVQPDSSYVEALLECDSLGNVRLVEMSNLQGRLIRMETSLKNNKFKTVAKTDTIKVYVKGNTEIRIREKRVEVDKFVYRDPWWKWPLIIWSLITTLIVVITYRKPIRSIITKILG